MPHSVDDLNDITHEAARAALAVLVKYLKPENFDSADAYFERNHKRRHPNATEAEIRTEFMFGLIEEAIVNQTEGYRAECKIVDRNTPYRDPNAGNYLLRSELI